MLLKFAYQDFLDVRCFKNTTKANTKDYEMLLGKFVDYCIESQFVAPNGFGKSTIATTFKALKSNKIELDKEDLFEGDIKNISLIPCLSYQ